MIINHQLKEKMYFFVKFYIISTTIPPFLNFFLDSTHSASPPPLPTTSNFPNYLNSGYTASRHMPPQHEICFASKGHNEIIQQQLNFKHNQHKAKIRQFKVNIQGSK